MKLKLITTASDPNHPGWLQFKRSLDHFGWDYHLIVHEYTNYNDKIIALQNYLKACELTHFIYADSYDSFVLAPLKEVEDKYNQVASLMYGLEKACWPHGEKADKFPEGPYPHKYVNGGGFVGPVESFLDLLIARPIHEAMNDQVWAQDNYIKHSPYTNKIVLDRDCSIFQTMAHTDPSEFDILLIDGENRLLNRHTKTLPVIFHGNGHTNIDWVYNLLS